MLLDCLSESARSAVTESLTGYHFRDVPPNALAIDIYEIPDWAKPPEGYVPQVCSNLDLQDVKLWLEKMNFFQSQKDRMDKTPIRDIFKEADLAWLERCYQRVRFWQLLQNWCGDAYYKIRPLNLTDQMARKELVVTDVNPLKHLTITATYLCCAEKLGNGIYDCIPAARYIVALQAAILGNLIACIANDEIIRSSGYAINRLVLYLVLFSKPYRTDWATCPMQELIADLYAANCRAQICLEERSFFHSRVGFWISFSYLSSFWREACWGIDDTVVGDIENLPFELALITAWPFLYHKFFGGLKANPALPPRNVEAKCSLLTKFAFSYSKKIESWHCVVSIQTYHATKKPERFPEVILGLNFNQRSNAILPAFSGQDMCGMPVVLVPVADKVRALLSKLYHIPQHNALYPEHRHIQTALQPTRTDWPDFISISKEFVYMGLVNLADFLEQRTTFSDPMQCPAENLCHLLYVGL